MKKILFIMFFAVFFSVLAVIASNNGNDFTNALKNCESYSESGNVKTEGISVQSKKQIVGWQNNKCVYKETVNFAGMNTTITCKLNKDQISELTSVMSAYNLLNKYSEDDVDTSSLESVKNNPVVKAWNKYLNDSSICTIEVNE